MTRIATLTALLITVLLLVSALGGAWKWGGSFA